jgi:hypothetical protein
MTFDIPSAIFSIPVLASSFLTTSPIGTLGIFDTPPYSRLEQLTPRIISEQTKQRQTRSLHVSVLDNMTYRYNLDVPGGPEPVTLRNGRYENEPAFKFVYRQDDPIGRGDLNSDGFEDAVVFLRTGIDRYRSAGLEMAIVLNRRGQPYNVDTVGVGADREDVLNVRVERGSIRLTLKTLRFQDPACCPTGRQVSTFYFRNNRLSPRTR